MRSLNIILMLTFTLFLASCSTDNKIDCEVTGERMTQKECDRAADKRSSDAGADKLRNPTWQAPQMILNGEFVVK